MSTVRVRLFAAAREAAGRRDDEIEAGTLGDATAAMCARYGPAFAAVLATARVWVDGDEPASGDATLLADGAEIAVLPPVSGGAGPAVASGAAGTLGR